MIVENTKHLLLKRAVLLMSFSLLAALLLRPLIIQMSAIFTIIGLANLLLSLSFYFYLSKAERKSWHPFLMLAIFIVVLIPILLLSGGVNSQFVALVPIVPLFLCLIGDCRAGRISAILLVLIIIFMTLFQSKIVDLTLDTSSIQKTYSRAVWLCISCVWGAYFGHAFDRLTSKLTNQLEKKASFDDLTQVANRRSILNFLALETKRQKQAEGWVCVLMIDADYFKAINDRFGHLIGDEFLREMAGAIQSCLLTDSHSVGRYGGEEFLVVLGNSNLSQSQEMAEKICSAVSKISIEVEGETVSLTATIGYCSRESQTIGNIDELIKYADDALYQGKRLGRNKVVSFG